MLSTAFCGPLCRCHQLFPCTEGSRAWNIASGPILGHLSSVNQTGGVGGERRRWTGRGGRDGSVGRLLWNSKGGQQTGLRSLS